MKKEGIEENSLDFKSGSICQLKNLFLRLSSKNSIEA